MTIDEQINKIIETAKSTGGEIELYVKTDICDADYSISTFQYSVDDFVKYEMGDIYKFLRTMADDWKSVRNMGHCTARNEIEEAHRQTIENRWDGKDTIADTLCGVPVSLSPQSFYHPNSLNYSVREIPFAPFTAYSFPSAQSVGLVARGTVSPVFC